MKTLRKAAKILSVALIFTLVFALCSCDLFGGSLKLESFTVDRSSVKTLYYIGEEIDFSGIKATVKYTDESLNTEYTAENLTVTYDEDITATVGTKTVTVSFEDPHLNTKQTTTVQITVREDPNAPKHDRFEVVTTGMKTEYFVGDTVDFTGIKVVEKFTNGGADVEMTDLTKLAYTYDAATITATAGTKTIPVTYNGEDAGAISITVKKPAITSATLNTTGLTLEYNVGDTVSFTGLTASVTYENNTQATVDTIEILTDLATVSATYGTKVVSVRLNDATSGTTRDLSFEIKVEGVVDYTMNTTGMDLTYLEGETVSFAGIVVTADYYFGADATVDFEDLTFVYDSNITATPGNKTVTVKVGEEVVGDIIVVVGDIPTAVANTAGVDLSYRVGETVSLAGLTVTLKYTDGTADATLALSDLTVVTDLAGLTATAGTKTVTVKYVFNGYDVLASVTLTVYGVDHYTVDASAMKTTYIVGDTLDYTGLVVKAHYLDGGEPEVVVASRLNYNDEGITATAGAKQIAVLVDGKSANVSVPVTVEKNAITSVVVGGSYDKFYEVGETLNLAGLTVTVTYKNGSVVTLTLADLTVGAVDMTTAGTKTVTLKFNDAVNGVEENTSTSIVVVKKETVAQFEQDGDITDFNSDKNAAGTANYGDTGFSGQFAKKAELYVIGDDNEFKYVPGFAIKDGESDKYLDAFYADVDIYLWVDGAYVKLEKREIKEAEYEYYEYIYNGEAIAKVDTFHGAYKFQKPLEKVKISVLPSADYYNGTSTLNPATLEAKVIDAYNVHETWQLAVLDNDPSRTDWNDFKTGNGILGYDPAGIVLHTDLHISKNDVPQSFLEELKTSIVYRNPVSGQTSTVPAGTKYLIDGTVLYSRQGAADFVIEGNYFTIDLMQFPLVASPGVFGNEGYGGDFSNAVFMAFEYSDENWNTTRPADVPVITYNNVALIGNAARNNWVDSQDKLVSAGGVIMVRSSRHAEVTLNNVINNSFFISYFTDWEASMTVNDSKAYDSYQNGAFVWADSVLTVNGSYINGSGGPVIISQSVLEQGTYYHPKTIISADTIVETHLSGNEIWFNSIPGVSAVVSGIQALGGGMQLNGLGNFVDANGKMNIKGILMRNGSGMEAMSDVMIQGTLMHGNGGIDRLQTSQLWGAILGKIVSNPQKYGPAPFLTVYKDGVAYTVYFVESEKQFYDLQDRPIGTDASHAALMGAFGAADQIALTQGGLSALLSFYHGKDAYTPQIPAN